MRTIGVLTKPDLIGPGNEDEVLAVLHNVRKPLKLGYAVPLRLAGAIPNKWLLLANDVSDVCVCLWRRRQVRDGEEPQPEAAAGGHDDVPGP